MAPTGASAQSAGFKIFRKEDVKHEWLMTLEQDQPELYYYLNGIRGVGKPYNFACLAYRVIRLIERHRILKPAGSVFLHCDATMSHYLKVAMDSIFQESNFLSDINWKRYAAHSLSSSCVDTISEQLLYYAKDRSQAFANTVLAKLSESELLSRLKYIEKQA